MEHREDIRAFPMLDQLPVFDAHDADGRYLDRVGFAGVKGIRL